MFDVSFSELLVICVVALVVIGPEKLPKVARTAGLLLGRLQRYVNNVKDDISREMQLDELRQLQAQIQNSAKELEHSIQKELAHVEEQASSIAQEAKENLSEDHPQPAISHIEKTDTQPAAHIPSKES